MTRLMFESTALHTSHLEKQTTWRTAIASELIARMPTGLTLDERGLRADALSGAALAGLMSAQSEWVRLNGRRPLAKLLDHAMEAVSPLNA
jgi:hypothetical protein